MLQITTEKVVNRAGTIEKKMYEWQVNQPVPTLKAGEQLTEIWANGQELEFIKTRFQNMPINTYNSRAYWCGDLAKIIYYNL